MEEIIDISNSIREGIKKLDMAPHKILFVVNEEILCGTVTDGDIRRWLLKSGDLQLNISYVMNKNPIYLEEEEKNNAQEIMKKNSIEAIPIVNKDKKIIKVIFLDKLYKKNSILNKKISVPVVIMAGGKGTRLYPYTNIIPKPLIPIGNISIVERIINKFLEIGCNNFYLTINYKKNMIKAYFDELRKKYTINYVEEEKFLGTGGSLFLLKDKIKETFFLSNCDILIDADYYSILKYHKKQNNTITMVTSLKNYTIPYGVIKLKDDGTIKHTEEKPEYNYLVNTGFYVLEPQVLSDIPKNEFFHITDLIDKYISEGKKVGTYPITENSWLDMGEIKEMERMIEKLDI